MPIFPRLYSHSSASWRLLRFPWYRKCELSLQAVTVTTPAAQAAVLYGGVGVSTRPDAWGSGAVEIATRNVFITGSVRVAKGHLTTPPAMRKQPSRQAWSSYGPSRPFWRWSLGFFTGKTKTREYSLGAQRTDWVFINCYIHISTTLHRMESSRRA